jgi:hypothetical protein
VQASFKSARKVSPQEVDLTITSSYNSNGPVHGSQVALISLTGNSIFLRFGDNLGPANLFPCMDGTSAPCQIVGDFEVSIEQIPPFLPLLSASLSASNCNLLNCFDVLGSTTVSFGGLTPGLYQVTYTDVFVYSPPAGVTSAGPVTNTIGIISNGTVTPVPEPSTSIPVGCAFLVLGWKIKRCSANYRAGGYLKDTKVPATVKSRRVLRSCRGRIGPRLWPISGYHSMDGRCSAANPPWGLAFQHGTPTLEVNPT